MTPQSWSTATVSARERFAYWGEAVCAAVLNVSVAGAAGPDFQGRIAARREGAVGYAAFRASAHAITRDLRQARAAGEERYIVGLQRAGIARIRQGDRAFRVEPGGLAVVEGWRPFELAFEGDVTRALAVVPRAAVAAQILPHTIAANAPYAGTLRALVARAAERGEPATDLLCDVLALAAGAHGAQGRAAAVAARRAALRALIARHLADPALSPGFAAERLGLSVRAVHSLLARDGASFGEIVRGARLELCARRLRDAADGGTGIADIALAAGFGDVSHFNHLFKRRFGVAPRDWRARLSAPARTA